MMNLKRLFVPVAALIFILGLVLPVFNLIQEERCSLMFSEIVTSDIVGIGISATETIWSHPQQISYLMKHPEQTLKNCMDFEDASPDTEQKDLNSELAKMAFKAKTGRILMIGPAGLKAALKNAGYDTFENKSH